MKEVKFPDSHVLADFLAMESGTFDRLVSAHITAQGEAWNTKENLHILEELLACYEPYVGHYQSWGEVDMELQCVRKYSPTRDVMVIQEKSIIIKGDGLFTNIGNEVEAATRE